MKRKAEKRSSFGKASHSASDSVRSGFVAGDQRLELLQHVAPALEAERVDGGGQIEDELAARGRLEVEDRDDLLALEHDVVVEQVAVDDALGQLAFEIVI